MYNIVFALCVQDGWRKLGRRAHHPADPGRWDPRDQIVWKMVSWWCADWRYLLAGEGLTSFVFLCLFGFCFVLFVFLLDWKRQCDLYRVLFLHSLYRRYLTHLCSLSCIRPRATYHHQCGNYLCRVLCKYCIFVRPCAFFFLFLFSVCFKKLTPVFLSSVPLSLVEAVRDIVTYIWPGCACRHGTCMPRHMYNVDTHTHRMGQCPAV